MGHATGVRQAAEEAALVKAITKVEQVAEVVQTTEVNQAAIEVEVAVWEAENRLQLYSQSPLRGSGGRGYGSG